MSTIVILVGNSDNKLTQKEWADFVSRVKSIVMVFADEVHFEGYSRGDSEYQNACFVFQSSFQSTVFSFDGLVNTLNDIKKVFGQNSIAIIKGITEFV